MEGGGKIAPVATKVANCVFSLKSVRLTGFKMGFSQIGALQLLVRTERTIYMLIYSLVSN